jgi:hypothetical protein
MFRSSDYRFGLLAGLFSLLSCLVFSQSISYQNPDGLSVCGSAPMEVTVNNTTGNVLQNVTVAVEFTTSAGTDCGIQYAPGSVSGAQEGNISNLSAPVFQLQNIAGGATVTFTINLEAPCSVGNCIDNAEFFVNEITLNYTGGSTSITTDPYEIATALLVITQVNSYVMGGVKGDVLQRKITIVNTRPAPLSSFIFTDTHQGGIEITSNQGNDISPGGNVFQLEIGGSDFAAVGDGDQLLELNESIVITENILITDCGVDISSTVSNINLGWGCNGEICQQTTVNAIVTIAESPSLPVRRQALPAGHGDHQCGQRNSHRHRARPLPGKPGGGRHGYGQLCCRQPGLAHWPFALGRRGQYSASALHWPAGFVQRFRPAPIAPARRFHHVDLGCLFLRPILQPACRLLAVQIQLFQGVPARPLYFYQ